ncbi:MAG: DUF542 domain-containing protein [Elusimicrobia bacterium]|nr:DUF542 domain-containing protein [Elusimicrobiota bacterium]
MKQISKEMKVSEVFETFPQTQGIFKKFGFGALLNPILRKTFGKVTSIERACFLHKVKLEEFLLSLNSALTETVEALESKGADPSSPHLSPEELMQVNNILNTNIRVLIERWPQLKSVFVKFFGDGCFSCPGFGMEDIAFACSMHKCDPILFSQECLKKIQESKIHLSSELLYIQASQTINQIIALHPCALSVFKKFGIDSCCGGTHRIDDASKAHGINYEELVKELLLEIRSGEIRC